MHIKKTKEWPFSSPTRYINSINKNEIPLIIDDFNDKEAQLLTLKKICLKISNWEEFEQEIDELNMRINDYQILLNKNKQSIRELI